MHLFHLGSTIGKFYSPDCQKVEWIGQHDLTNKTIIEFLTHENPTTICWLAVLNGAKKVYVYAPTKETQDQAEYAKYINTPTIGHNRIFIIESIYDMPPQADIIIDPIEKWNPPDGSVVINNPKKPGLVSASSYLSLFGKEFEKELDDLPDNTVVITDDAMKAIVAVYKGAKLVQLKASGNYRSLHNLLLYYLPPTLLSKITIIKSS